MWVATRDNGLGSYEDLLLNVKCSPKFLFLNCISIYSLGQKKIIVWCQVNFVGFLNSRLYTVYCSWASPRGFNPTNTITIQTCYCINVKTSSQQLKYTRTKKRNKDYSGLSDVSSDVWTKTCRVTSRKDLLCNIPLPMIHFTYLPNTSTTRNYHSFYIMLIS